MPIVRKIMQDSKMRSFGVDNSDAYWIERNKQGRNQERRLHRFLFDTIGQISPLNGTILDCGTGSGHVFRLCMEKYRVYGIEQSAEAIKGYDFPAVNIKQHDLNNGIPDFGTQFDVIVISMVLHWLNNPAAFLKQAKEKLTSDGRLLVVVPNITYYRFRIAYLLGQFPPISLSHKNFQVPREVEQMFDNTGFQIERRLSPKRSFAVRFLPAVFSSDLVYVLKPR
jgi:2-polyprenyl-3-methyl-5-hydroxy-6-metoxy-1,4-benzoquinol methylase